MPKQIQLTIRVSESLRKQVEQSHKAFCDAHLIEVSFNSFLVRLLELGIKHKDDYNDKK